MAKSMSFTSNLIRKPYCQPLSLDFRGEPGSFLFATRYPQLVQKLILIGSGAFENKYNRDFIEIRLKRLSHDHRREAERLITLINSQQTDNDTLKQFGRLMTMADSYDFLTEPEDTIDLDMEIHRSVWAEASQLRNTNELLNDSGKIACPVVAIHGDYDPHPYDGVCEPLTKTLNNFKMIRLDKCGHKPWKEKLAKDTFYKLLKEELL